MITEVHLCEFLAGIDCCLFGFYFYAVNSFHDFKKDLICVLKIYSGYYLYQIAKSMLDTGKTIKLTSIISSVLSFVALSTSIYLYYGGHYETQSLYTALKYFCKLIAISCAINAALLGLRGIREGSDPLVTGYGASYSAIAALCLVETSSLLKVETIYFFRISIDLIEHIIAIFLFLLILVSGFSEKVQNFTFGKNNSS